jgi:DNA-directed RNA polymerase subunit RPC12/RpoP
MDQGARDSEEITFDCPSCGARFAVREAVAGEQSQCPKCGQMMAVTVTHTQDTAPDVAAGPDAMATQSRLYDLQFLDLPPHTADTSTRNSEQDAYRKLQMLQLTHPPGPEGEAPRRKLPWIIDVFLYPVSKAGLSILLIGVGVPFLLRVIVRFFSIFMGAFAPMLIFWVLSIILHWGVLAVLVLYVNWYFCECIRDSAAGGIRAADTTGTTPGLGEIFGQAIRVIVSAAICMAPALIYLNETGTANSMFWVLFGAGGFFIPMALLAVVMFDGLHGLNPALLLRSILKTFFQYCALAAFCYAPCLLVPVAGYYLVKQWILGSVLLFLTYYQLLILAHLLGRFYWRNEERLQWDA